MTGFRTLSIAAALVCLTACSNSPGDAATAPPQPEQASLDTSTILKLDDVKTSPTDYDFEDFKPNVQKLILAGTADSKHVAILWYTVTDGGVALHYHAQTESVYVIDGTQTDAKGVYPTGTAYFNPPGSGHQITDSSGFFLLAYAAPPDFTDTDLIGDYTPIRIDTAADDLTSQYPFEAKEPGVQTFAPALDAMGGMSAELIHTTSSKQAHAYTGNYLLVLKGSCDIEGMTFGANMLVVSKTTDPQPYTVSASKDRTCLAMGISF